MVSNQTLSKEIVPANNSPAIEEVSDDDSSSINTDDEEDEENAVVVFDGTNNNKLNFGNIAVSNSTDVHFGTYIQGPVTIKQIWHPNSSASVEDQLRDVTVDTFSTYKGTSEVKANGQCNAGFQPDGTLDKNSLKPDKGDNEQRQTATDKGTKWTPSSRQLCVIGTSLGVILLISLTTVAVLLTSRHHNDADDDPNTFNVTLPEKTKIMSRLEWLAQPPVQPANPLILPVPYVIISHTATENCSSIAQCVFQVRYIQTFHIESRDFWDIGYNFLVGGDGQAYEGRGWKSEGAHTYGYNSKSIGISFIGTFNAIKPPPQQIKACNYLIRLGVELGYIAKDYKILGARQLQTTQSPGQVLFDEIKKWPHWSPSP